MSRKFLRLLVVIVAAYLGFVVAVFVAKSAAAEELGEPQIIAGIVCDTKEQIVELANLVDAGKEFEAAIQKVNEEEDKAVCAGAVVAFNTRKSTGVIVSVQGERFTIYAVDIIGVSPNYQSPMIGLQEPLTQYMAFPIEGIDS